MKSSASTPSQYLKELPEERRRVVQKLRRVVRRHLPTGFRETMDYGMLAYVVPHRLYPDGYHCDPQRPLPFINLAAQKNYVSFYHMGLYSEPLLGWLVRQWPRHTQAPLDLGKCCIRLKDPESIPYALLGELCQKLTPEQWIALYEAARPSTSTRRRRSPATRPPRRRA